MELDFTNILDGLPGLVWTAFPDGRADFINRQWCEYTGFSAEEARGEGWQAAVHPDDRLRLVEDWITFTRAGEPAEREARLRRHDGEYRRFLFRISPLADDTGTIVRWCGINTDIEDRKRAEVAEAWAQTLLDGEKQLLQRVAQGAPLADVLAALCRLVEQTAVGSLCSVLTIDPQGGRFRNGAGPSLPPAYNRLLDGLVMDRNYGPCGRAADERMQVIAADVVADPRWKTSPWPELVAAHGLRSCWSTPILSGTGEVIGVFALYQRQPSHPTQIEQDLISQFAHLASIAIERAQGDAALTQSEARKAAVLDSSLDCIVTIDHAGRITEFNPAAERTFGFRRDEVMGRPLADVIIPPALRDQHRRGLARYLATGQSRVLGRHIEFTAMRADGGEFPVELAITRIPSDGPPSFTGFLRDISERKRSEEALRRSEGFLAEGQRLSLTGSFSWRPETDEIRFSEELSRILGLEPDEPPTLQAIASRVHPDDLPLFTDKIAGTRAGVDDDDYEIRLRMPDGRVKYLHSVSHRMRGQDGRLEYIGAIQDITERRVSEEALDKVRSEFAEMARVTSLGALTASIAHEVNQPLAGIITNASTCLKMLGADPPNVAGALETARRTIRDGNRAADVIRRLRTLFGKRDGPLEVVDLNEATREVIALSSNELQRARASLREEFAEPLPSVTGDRVQLQQVILNLLLNGADAMSEVEDRPRQLVVRTERDEAEHVRLSVRDAGTGFGPQDAERLFEAFYTTKSSGMGIGLFVSRSIVESHGGRLWAAPNEGPGATFAFSIPCAPDDGTGDDGSRAARPVVADAAPRMGAR